MSEITPPKYGHGDEKQNPLRCIKCGKQINIWDYFLHNAWTLHIGIPIRFFIHFYCSKCWKTVNRRLLEFRK